MFASLLKTANKLMILEKLQYRYCQKLLQANLLLAIYISKFIKAAMMLSSIDFIHVIFIDIELLLALSQASNSTGVLKREQLILSDNVVNLNLLYCNASQVCYACKYNVSVPNLPVPNCSFINNIFCSCRTHFLLYQFLACSTHDCWYSPFMYS